MYVHTLCTVQDGTLRILAWPGKLHLLPLELLDQCISVSLEEETRHVFILTSTAQTLHTACRYMAELENVPGDCVRVL
jgi:hypothetical protein